MLGWGAMQNEIDLIVGLGNPGTQYLTTRHNAGFWFIDLLSKKHTGTFRTEKRFHGDVAQIVIDNRRIWLLKPQTYMNESGRSVEAITTYYNISLENTFIAHDDLDLRPGRTKLKFAGGHGGHNGLRDVIRCVGNVFWRLRLGIGHPGPGQREIVTDYVLKRASGEDEIKILDAIGSAVEIIPIFLQHGEDKAKNLLHKQGAEINLDQESGESSTQE